MDKYQAVAIVNVCEVILALSIILLAGLFNNYYLLLLLLLIGTSSTEKRILGIRSRDDD